MKLTWLGAAGFEIKTKDHFLYLDPFLSRNSHARPIQTKTIDDIHCIPKIFISHGHFDHLMDIPQIADTCQADIYSSTTVAAYLKDQKIPASAIHTVSKDSQQFSFDTYTARALFSEHVSFDAKLVLSTLLRSNTTLFSCLPLLSRFPCGQVLGWRFNIENKVVLFYGSAGSSRKELERAARTSVDILLVPLQGHSDICTIGLDYVKILQPEIVIPHHHDNFFPPISQQIDIRPFVDKVSCVSEKTRVLVPEMNVPINL
ncbi:MAG: MBL fold metallo-hydrolase [Desulfobacula sp.]|nr:MBL fold metallo-hydrolase [Desulfobacula sp.]